MWSFVSWGKEALCLLVIWHWLPSPSCMLRNTAVCQCQVWPTCWCFVVPPYVGKLTKFLMLVDYIMCSHIDSVVRIYLCQNEAVWFNVLLTAIQNVTCQRNSIEVYQVWKYPLTSYWGFGGNCYLPPQRYRLRKISCPVDRGIRLLQKVST